MALQKFRRSRQDRRLAGVFGGLGEAFGVDPTYLRLAFVLLAVLTGVFPALIGYAVAWRITLDEPADGAKDGAGESTFGSA